jgi:hypothetical protein
MKRTAGQQFIKLGIVFILALTLSLPATSSLAASENEAQVFRDSYCLEYEGSTICYANRGVITETTTPSGITVFHGSGWSTYSETDPSGIVVYQDSLTYLTQGLQRESVLSEYAQFFSYSETRVGGGTCTIDYAFHFVNNEIQFERATTCS